MYHEIATKKPVAELYAEKLAAEDRLPANAFETLAAEVHAKYEAALSVARETRPRQKIKSFDGAWSGLAPAGNEWDARTAVEPSVIELVSRQGTFTPEDFNVHPKLKRLLVTREEMGQGSRPVDWGCAEMWAFGSLLLEGTPVRLAGQDSERGTFSHRHAVLHDVGDDRKYVPLQNLKPDQACFCVVNTMLSELAVLGFEYGFSRAEPRALVLWEAQFGDFVNGAQPIIDQFIAASESKWQRMSGIVLLLPHGYEGQGPEHSSARLERFLQLCAENNLQVAYPTVPAQYFHLLRRQMRRPFRKPLVLMMPKSLLRHPQSTSQLNEFTEAGFQSVLGDPVEVEGGKVTRVLVCSGKVFFTLLAAREEGAENLSDIAIVRVEQMYPFPDREIAEKLAGYSNAREILWVQEEPKNMGGWTFMQPRLQVVVERILGKGAFFQYCGRPEAASPAGGSYKAHQEQEKRFVAEAFGLKAEASTKTKKTTAKV
jgi:2-oxoglutarate dehydrogenase E1 component